MDRIDCYFRDLLLRAQSALAPEPSAQLFSEIVRQARANPASSAIDVLNRVLAKRLIVEFTDSYIDRGLLKYILMYGEPDVPLIDIWRQAVAAYYRSSLPWPPQPLPDLLLLNAIVTAKNRMWTLPDYICPVEREEEGLWQSLQNTYGEFLDTVNTVVGSDSSYSVSGSSCTMVAGTDNRPIPSELILWAAAATLGRASDADYQALRAALDSGVYSFLPLPETGTIQQSVEGGLDPEIALILTIAGTTLGAVSPRA